MYGFCKGWVCVCMGFVICGCVYVWIIKVWMCACVGFVTCGCFGNMCTCIYSVFFYFFFYVYLFLFVISVRTTATE